MINLETKKTRYCSRFALLHKSSFYPHYKFGETLGKKQSWRNVGQHCLVAGIFAEILADALRVPSSDKNIIVEAAIIHDWYKKHEAIAQDGLRKQNKLTLQDLDDIKEMDKKALEDFGMHSEVIYLSGANVPESEAGPQTLSQKIIWYVDAMLSNTEPMPIKERFKNLERGWDGTKEDCLRASRNNLFSELFRPKYNGKSIYELQIELADIIGEEFAKIMNYEGASDDLPLYLKKIFIGRIL